MISTRSLSAFALAVFCQAAGTVQAAPVTNDLWDASQAGHVAAGFSNDGGSFCGNFDNIFGTNAGLCGGADPGAWVSMDGALSHRIEWGTSSVTIGSFKLYASGDGNGNRELNQFTISVFNGTNFVVFYTSPVYGHPQSANDGSTPFAEATLGASVTGTRWMIEVFSNPAANENVRGVRLLELDGFAPSPTQPGSVPEPGTLALLGMGVGVLIWRKHR